MNMNTKIYKMEHQQNDAALLEEAGAIIRNGGLVAFPTETVYGLGGDAMNPSASQKIYAAKGRPSDNPLIVHIWDYSQLEEIAAELPPEAKKLSDAFWPGPMTLIVPKNDKIPYETTGGLDTVAVRMPSHEVAREFIRVSGCMIAAPSANTSGRPSPTTADHVWQDLNGKIDAIIDGGAVDIGLESTCSKCT
jgi:L-threonylcarbamoyladenylate synthase